jgi:hypothetical protein
MNSDIRKAVAVFRNSKALDDVAIYKVLVADGVERQSAARLVAFLPMVYCRLLLASSGARFSNKYRSMLPDGTMSPVKLLANEPLWNSAMEFAKAEINGGISAEDVLSIAGRAAEFHAANQLLKRGSKLENLGFDAPTIRWIGTMPRHQKLGIVSD